MVQGNNLLKDRAEVCQSLDSSLRLQCLKYKSILPQDTAPVLPTQPRLTVGKIMNKKEEREQIWLSSVILRNIIEDRVWLLEPREINIMLAWSFACAGEVFRSYPRAACRDGAGGAFPSLPFPFLPLQSAGFRRRHCTCWAFLYRWAWSTHPCFLQQLSDGRKEQVLLHKTNSSSTVQPFTHVLLEWSTDSQIPVYQ